MKIKIIKSFRTSQYSDYIDTGEELEARRLTVSPFDVFDLTTPYQITEGKHSGQYVPYVNCIRLPDQKTYSEQQYSELKQENLQRLEEVKGLQRKVKSLDEYARKKAEQNRILRHDSNLIYGDYKKLKVENELMAATLERAMLDHQPVVLPKRQTVALDRLREAGFGNYDIITSLAVCSWSQDLARHFNELFDMDRNVLVTALVNDYTVEPEPEKIILSKEIDKAIKYALDTHWYRDKKEYLLKVHRNKSNSPFHNEMYALNNISTELLEKALFEGYTVKPELTLPIVEELADMIQKWTNEPTFEDEATECLALATVIAERTKEFYSK